MILHFLKLEWKQFFRSSHWQKGIALKIIMGFVALYFLIIFLGLGIGGYFILQKEFPASDPLKLLNSYLLFAILGDLIFRYLLQKLPIMNIKPLLILPIKRNKLVHYFLGKSAFSVFNILGLFFYIPFSFVLIKEGYNTVGVLGWLFSLVLSIQSANLLNFLINKNNKYLIVIAIILLILVCLHRFGFANIIGLEGSFFDFIYQYPIYSILGIMVLALLYLANYNQLRKQVYLDETVQAKVEEANTVDLSWTDKLVAVAPFIKNDIRLIWRNKRTKTVFLISFLFLFYGLLFFTQETYLKMPAMLMGAALFITGGFTLNYGQFIPAWDSTHFKMLMSQSFRYRKFLESKWVLMKKLLVRKNT